MSISTFSGIETALSGLEAAQASIDTTGNNIANANTPDYAEETVNLVESPEQSIPTNSEAGSSAQLGTGVSVTSISSAQDEFLNVAYRTQNAQTSNANTLSTQLQQVQTAVNEPSSDGIQEQLSNFWSAWSDLANTSSGSAYSAALSNVISKGQALASTMNSVSQQMTTVQTQAAAQYSQLTGTDGQVANDASQLATLNQQIANETQSGTTPNALLDQRNAVLDDLSGLANVSVTNNSDGTDTVTFGDASSPLVDGTTVNWPQTLTSAAGGQLGALQTLASTTSGPITSMLSSLNGVASQVISSVNALQPSSPFFSGTDASNIAVSATTSTIQTSSSATSGTDLATSIAGLAGGTADQNYAAFVGQVGSAVSGAQSTDTTAQSVLTAIGNQRDSVTGVSLDEEMSNLITYQNAYQASARMMNTMNTVIQSLLSSVSG
jgi:flagellar hook-associated protein 1 FlgK